MPGECFQITYTNEKGKVFKAEMQKTALNANSKVLIIDDLLESGEIIETC